MSKLILNSQSKPEINSSNPDRIDSKYLIKQVCQQLDNPVRRLFAKHLFSLGSLTLMTGCTLTDGNDAEKMLMKVSKWNDKVQAFLFDPTKLVKTYPESMIAKPFPFNAYYDESEIRDVDRSTYWLALSGLIRDKRPWTLEQLSKLPQNRQVTRHICVEGWSAIGKWGGVNFGDFLRLVGADTTAKFVGFRCVDDYYTSIDMASALHSQTQLSLKFGDQDLSRKYGNPLKLRVPTKLGFKNPKYITKIYVTNTYPGGYWEDQGYNWFSGA